MALGDGYLDRLCVQVEAVLHSNIEGILRLSGAVYVNVLLWYQSITQCGGRCGSTLDCMYHSFNVASITLSLMACAHNKR